MYCLAPDLVKSSSPLQMTLLYHPYLQPMPLHSDFLLHHQQNPRQSSSSPIRNRTPIQNPNQTLSLSLSLSLSLNQKKKNPNTAATKNRERFERYRIMRFGKRTGNRRFRWARTRNSTNSGETKREMDRNGAEAQKRCRFLEERERFLRK